MTLIELFEQSTHQFANHSLILTHNGTEYQGLSYSDAHQQVLQLASGLVKAGVEMGDRVAILSENRAEWMIADLAILYAGAIVTTLSAKLIEKEDLRARIENAEPRILLVSDKQFDKVASLNTNVRIINFDSSAYLELQQSGDKASDTEVQERMKRVHDNDPATIIFTSGTTGNPKGVVLSHHNNVVHIDKHRPLGDFQDRSCTMAFLPLDHCLFHAFFYMAMAHGASVAIPQFGKTPLDTMLNMMKNIREAHPDLLVVVPAMLQTFKMLLIQQGCHDDVAKAKAFFGGRLHHFAAGGALTDAETERFFLRLNLPIHIGYGMTEATAGVSRSYPAHHRTGSIGRPASLQQEVKVVDEQGQECATHVSGEIIYRGETVMLGYWRNPEATREVLTDDGWFHTGDLGHFDEDGYLYIDGRVKSMLISNSGEKYSPEGIEAALIEQSPLIKQVLLHNQQSPCTIALICPNKAQLRAAINQQGLSLKTEEGQNAAINLIREVLATYRKGGSKSGTFPDIWLPNTFALISEPFSPENGQMTPTQKLIRHKIAAAYQQRIAELFTPAGMNPLNEANRQAIND